MSPEIKPYEAGEKIETEQVEKTYQPPSAGDEFVKTQHQSLGPISPPPPPFKSLPQSLPDIEDNVVIDLIVQINKIRKALKGYARSRELSLAATKMDEACLWLHELRDRLENDLPF